MNGKPFWWGVVGLLMMSTTLIAAEAPVGQAVSNEAVSPGFICSGSVALAGPADGCCERHASFCEAQCTGRSYEFTCWTNSTGGCQSTCKCSGGPPPI